MKQIRKINKILVVIIIIHIFLFLVGVTYSYFSGIVITPETDTTLRGEAGQMDITYDGGPNIIADTFIPSSKPFATKTFTLTGNSIYEDSVMGYRISLIVDENTFSSGAISFTLYSDNVNKNGETIPSIESHRTLDNVRSYFGTGHFSGVTNGDVHSYELKMYFLDTNTDQSADKNKSIKVHVEVENYVDLCALGQCYSLKDQILEQGGGAEAIELRGAPSFSGIAGSGLYAALDEYGTSYYYRGNHADLKNNLIWGGFQWKIVRINGDGSIRIIYNGTEAQFNSVKTVNTTGTNTQIGKSAFNVTYSSDAKYLGYMYGGANGVASVQRNGTVSTAATYNQTSNAIKKAVDNWYKLKIADTPFEAQVVDNLFCNDRQLQSGGGYGKSVTNYKPHNRLYTNRIPTLKCAQQNDHFTTSVDGEVGNGALTYPVGLLTADEGSMAGLLWNTANNSNYLRTNNIWWSLSPFWFYSNGIASTFLVLANGGLYWMNVTTSYGVRPVVSLASDIQVTGIGSATDPFKVLVG